MSDHMIRRTSGISISLMISIILLTAWAVTIRNKADATEKIVSDHEERIKSLDRGQIDVRERLIRIEDKQDLMLRKR